MPASASRLVSSTVAVIAVALTVDTGSSGAAQPSDPAGVPFVTFAHATAASDFSLACAQLSRIALMRAITPRPRTLAVARKVCVRSLGSERKELDEGRRLSLASVRVVRVQVKPGRARVTVQSTLYGVQPRATGTAIVEDGRWKIGKPASGDHVGSSLVYRIPSESMVPTLRAGDTVLADQAAYRHSRPRIGDVVVFHPPEGSQRERQCGRRPPKRQACAIATRRNSTVKFIKRIVAGPGDRVSIRDGHVIRNGARAGEDFITPCDRGDRYAGCDFPRTFTVAAGRYYVLGDNRGNSDDSRYWGPVPARSMIGRVTRLGP